MIWIKRAILQPAREPIPLWRLCNISVAPCPGLMAISSCCIALEMRRERVTTFYSGPVQGVGFRYTVNLLVNGFEVTGTVRNLPDGRVELVAEGVRAELEGLLEAVRRSDVGRFIRQEQSDWTDANNEFRTFQITP